MLNADILKEMAKDCDEERIRTMASVARCAGCLLGSICPNTRRMFNKEKASRGKVDKGDRSLEGWSDIILGKKSKK